MLQQELIRAIEQGALDARFASLYGAEAIEAQRARYVAAIHAFAERFGKERDVRLFSVPGRSELSGNHTDHNRGAVIATSIHLDVIAVASAREDSTITVLSAGFPEDRVDISAYTAPRAERFARSDAIIAGMCAGLRQKGHAVGGFDAYTTSNVLKGSGLSSSAAFEVMIGNIENHLYNAGRVDNVEIAKIAQYAENEFFGKPCGLMDQVACAAGGIVAIDFEKTDAPVIEQIDFDLTARGYALCIVDTGGNHADLTPDYAAVPAEMRAVAAALGKTVLRESDKGALLASLASLRERVGDRAVLRALHFYNENERVARQKAALLADDLAAYFALVLASGRSSFCYLQNVYTTANVKEQGLSLALCLAEDFLSGKDGAFRVHGGGFAGTIQAYVKTEDVADFCTLMDGVFGKDAAIPLHVRAEGAIALV